MTEALESHLRRQVEHSRGSFWHQLRWRAVRGYLPEEAPFSLVDVGAGAGMVGESLSRDRPEATYRFVESIESLRQLLTARYGETADLGESADFSECEFVTLLDVLEHQEDDHAFMQELVAKTAPGTLIFVTVPAGQHLWSQWDVALGHYRRYDKETLCGAIAGLRLDVLELSYLFPELVPLGLLRARRSSQSANVEGGEEFPDFPGFVNGLLYAAGSVSLALRKRWRGGTSLFLVVRTT